MAWCPWQSNVLASGGGTADRHIRLWNTTTGTCLTSVDTKSQVTAQARIERGRFALVLGRIYRAVPHMPLYLTDFYLELNLVCGQMNSNLLYVAVFR